MAKIDKTVPCYMCEKRKPLCHGSCEDYKTYKQAQDDKAKTIRKQRNDENMIDEVRLNAIHKAMKNKIKQTAWKG